MTNVDRLHAAMRLMATAGEWDRWKETLGPYSDVCDEEGLEAEAILARAITTRINEEPNQRGMFLTKFDKLYTGTLSEDIQFPFAGMHIIEVWLSDRGRIIRIKPGMLQRGHDNLTRQTFIDWEKSRREEERKVLR